MNRLSIVRGPRSGEVIDLAGGSLTIGSDATAANLALDDAAIASVHCRIAAVKGGGFGIQDLGTPGGTQVNGKKITAARLNPGDRIRIGAVEFLYESSDPAPAPQTAPPPPAPSPSPSASSVNLQKPGGDPDLSGRLLGGYQLNGILGRGGMGIVYKATQTSLNRNVALKVLSPSLARDPKFVDLFLREARAAAQLHHPNVVTIFDVGTEDGLHYYSMEVFDGGSAEQLLKKERKLSVEKSLGIARDAARALEFAESKHLLHRDVKPDNLMLSAQGVAKLADLGLATHRGDAGAPHFGTPHFVAPECLKGGAVDHRSDLYSLGATLYRMLTGRTPFQGANITEILDGVQNREAPALRTVDATIPEGVEALVAKLLQKDPARRHASAREVVAAIDELLAPPQKPASKSLIFILGGIAVAAVAGGAYIFFKPVDPATTKPVVIRDTEEADRLREENNKKERAMREKDAEIAYTKIKAESAPALDRAAKFEQVAKDYEGTPSAANAIAEAKKLREDEKLRLAQEAAKQKAVGEYKQNLESGLQSRMNEGNFAGALQFPKQVDGYDTAGEDQDAKAAIAVVPERVLAALGLHVKEQMNRAEAARSASQFDAAREIYTKLIASLDAMLALPAEQLPAAQAADIQNYKNAATTEMAKLSTSMSAQLRDQEKQVRTAAGAALALAFETARAGKPGEAGQSLAALATPATPPDLGQLLGMVRGDLEAGETMLQKVLAASQKKSLGNEQLTDPVSNKSGKVIRVDEAGVHLDAKGATVIIPMDKLGAPQLSQLYLRVAEKSAADQLAFARAALAASYCHEIVNLRNYQFAVKPQGGSPPAPPPVSDDVFQSAADAAKMAQQLGAPADACTQLLQRIELERAAARAWRDGLAAFAEGQFSSAERQLGELLKNGRASVSFTLATDGSPAPDPAKK